MWWVASERSIRDSVRNAVKVAEEKGMQSIAFPLIGAGTGSVKPERCQALMLDELSQINSEMRVVIVIYGKR